MGLKRIENLAFALFLTNITMLAGTSVHFLDIEELKSIHYDIDILENPVLYGRPLHTEVVYLSSKFGQRYECQLPDVADVGKVQEEEKSAAETGISDLLKPMELAPCLLKNKDWWTYEFCYGKHVRQFHLENSQVSGEVITIGVFESEMDWKNKSHSAAKRHRLNRYHSHRYVNGSNCDLTGKPREAEVRFLCAENELDTMTRIDEPESCRYVITVHTMRICHHPYLKPPAKAKPKTILCYPLLMQEQYDQYMHQQTKHRYSKEAQEGDIADDEKEGKESISGDLDDSDDNEDSDDDDLELLEEHHLNGDASNLGPDKALAEKEVGRSAMHPDELANLLTEVVEGVQGTIKKINSQLEGDGTPGDESIDDDDDEDDMELLKMDYKALIDAVKYLPTENQAEAMELIKELEETFQSIDAMEKVLDQIDDDLEDSLQQSDSPSEDHVTVLETNMDDDMIGEDEINEGVTGESLMKEEMKEKGEEDKEEFEEEGLDENHLTETLNRLIRKLKENDGVQRDSSSSDNTPSESGDVSNRVRVRVTRVKLDKNQKASSEQEVKFLDTDHQDIEKAISDQLEKSGVNKNGASQFEVRILSYVPEEWPDQGTEEEGFAILNEEDSSYFRNMIFSLVMRDDGEVQSRQAKLQKNYGFQWNADPDMDQSKISDESRDQEEVQILIPRFRTKDSSQEQGQSDPES
ncbi:protein OS-9-like isoform X1 [Lytechinus variegatus]|uniref:protein OS-9-like isoform X1 n=1 Tax=Lytechinus variegatus TaxID=7654 RepID=UPI001BB13943|nr:protein OS-9-like isoform X1 [Lytechinus variegatus]